MKKILGLVSGGMLALAAPVMALAQSDYNYNYDYGTNTISDGAAAGLGIGMMIFFGIAMLIGLAFFIFWIMMLVDAIKRQWPERSTWMIILIVSMFFGLSWLASILYYFLVKRKNVGTVGGSSAVVPPMTPAK